MCVRNNLRDERERDTKRGKNWSFSFFLVWIAGEQLWRTNGMDANWHHCSSPFLRVLCFAEWAHLLSRGIHSLAGSKIPRHSSRPTAPNDQSLFQHERVDENRNWTRFETVCLYKASSPNDLVYSSSKSLVRCFWNPSKTNSYVVLLVALVRIYFW